MDRNKIIKMTVILAAIVVIAGSVSRLLKRDSMSLSDYARLHSDQAASSAESASGSLPENSSSQPATDTALSASPTGPRPSGTEEQMPPSNSALPSSGSSDSSPASSDPFPGSSDSPSVSPDPSENEEEVSQPVGASLNGTSQLDERWTLEDGFYYEPLSENLQRYITGISYPSSGGDGSEEPQITLQELRYVHILHYDFDGNPAEGELICNEYIARDLVEIFCELYRNEYKLERVQLIDEYDGDDDASMEANNTSCFNYRPVEGSSHLSKHAFGLAIDINPLYNPYIAYNADGTRKVSPAGASPYADRSADFPYKIDENDLCYSLFKEHGFIWGGNWNNIKDYQHFQKTK